MLWVLKKNRLNETVLLSTQNMSSSCWIRKYLQFYAQKFCLSKHMSKGGATTGSVCVKLLTHGSCSIKLIGRHDRPHFAYHNNYTGSDLICTENVLYLPKLFL